MVVKYMLMYSIFKNSSQDLQSGALEAMVEKLAGINEAIDFQEFYSAFRKTELPFIPCYEKDPKKVYQNCFEVLQELGSNSVPVAVALSMHYYVLASMAMYPFSKKSKEYWKRELLLQKIKKERLLIANTGSVRTFKNAMGNKEIIARRDQDNYYINGEASFMSLSGIADYMVFTAPLPKDDSAEKAIFFIPAENENIVFLEDVFDDAMHGSFTRGVRFNNVKVSNGNVIKLDNSEDERCEVLVYQRSWFQGMVPAPYLGASQRVLDELKLFSAEKIKNGKKLSESEAFRKSLGGLMIKYQTAMQLCANAGQKMSEFRRDDQPLTEQLFEATVLAKHYATHGAEEIVTTARHLMGTSFLAPNSMTNKIYKEIVFGVLQPMSDLDIKKYFGDKL